MKTQLKRSLFCALLFILAMIKRSLAACDMYNLGEDCVPSCSRPGILLEDGKTCFCDPEKFLIDSERKKCVKKLGLGKYPSLKDDDADPNLHHMSAEKCNDKCRTCKIAEDFTSGDADHCTSCSMEGPFILDLTGAKPTCVAELPDNSAMVIIRKNRIIGVSNQTSEYGGSDENGELIDELQKDDEDDSYTSSNPGYGFGSCPDGNCSASGDGSMPPMNNSTMPPTNNSTMPPMDNSTMPPTDNSTMPPMDNSTMPPTDNSTTPPMGDSSDDDNMIYNTFFPPAGMLPTDNLTIMSGLQMWRADFADRRDMPTVISLLEKAGVEGIGFKQGREESCIGSIGEERKPRGTQLDVIYVAVPCPDGCKECKVGEYGHLECTKPVDGKFVAEGKVLDACPDSHWFTLGEECIPCPAGPAGRCPACNINMTDPFNIIFECTQCPNNDPTVDLSVMGITFKVCNSTHQCENNEYFDGSSCASCGDNCAACMGDTCGFCSKDFAMKLNTDGTRECVPREDGCPRNHYVNDMNICTECDASCDGCWQRGSEYCFACSDTTKVLRPTQFLRVFKLNQEMEKDYNMGMSGYQLEYKTDDFPLHGECVADCNLEGFALWNSSNVCKICEPAGCSKCDTTGQCLACDEKQGLRLVDDVSGSGDKMCSKCWLPDCKLCDDDSTMSCKMCEKGYSLQDQGGMKMCVKRCSAGTFREKMTMDKATVPDFIKNLDYGVCKNCSADCSKCKDKADFCLQCSADGKFAQPDGTCATTCPDGTYPRDGRCKKCGPNIATCGINTTTEEFEVKTCDVGFFVGTLKKKCVPEFRCGKGFYGDTGTKKCTECDKLKCVECKGAADKCTKCKEIGEFASKDGSCKTDPDTVECEDGFYLKAGICKKCDPKCNGCTGEGNSNCLACADNMLAAIKSVSTTSGGPTVYTCVDKCPILHEIVDDNGVSMCSSCPNHATKKVFDLTTHTCVIKDTGCPSNTIQANATIVFPKLANGSNADTQICIPCSDRCATCSPMDPHMCLTCAADFFTNEYVHTDPDTGTKTNFIKCQEKCKPETFAKANNVCSGECLADCGSCDDNKTCNRCKKGFYLDNSTDTANHVCVPENQCPANTYGNTMSGKCEPCDAKCKECSMGASMCTECPTSEFLLPQHHKCFTKCPKGTYFNNTNCSPCEGNLLNCNQTTGMPDNPMDNEHCAQNCAGCIWSKNYCIDCAAGFKKASNGRCIKECPAGTVEREVGGFTYCKKCGEGCTKCIDEEENCDGASATSNSTAPKIARCIRCDRNLDYFLFRDHCVQECPHGTYKDEITGWCAKCSCNCGDGGCSDAYTCNTCTQPNTELDTESGMCKCKTKSSAKWADDWQTFTITIESADVAFRDFKAEAMSSYDFSKKTCRIGNEPFKIGNKTYVNMDPSDLMNNTDFDASKMDPSEMADMDQGMFGNRTNGNQHNVTYDETHVPLNICGDWGARREEMKHIKEELGAMNIDHAGGMYGDMSDGMQGMGNTTGGMGDSPSNGTTTPPTGSDPSSTPPTGSSNMDDHKISIDDSTGYCPAHVPSYNMMDLYQMGIYSLEDVYWHMGSLQATFGNITDDMLNEFPDTLAGLEFTENPDNLCDQLFDNSTLWMLGDPTCTFARENGKTIITVTPGKWSYVHSEMELYFKPNVFTEGCEFPVLTHLVVEDAAIPDSLEVAFNREDDIPICEELSLMIESKGNIGTLYCMIGIQSLIDESGNMITTDTSINITTDIMDQNIPNYGFGVYTVGATKIASLYGEGARKIIFEGYCFDFFGQESYLESEYNLITQSSGIKMAFDVESLVYDTNFGEYAFFEFEFADCSTGATSEVNVTIITQRVNSTGDWEDVTDPALMAQGEFIPPGLSIDEIYRLKVIVSVPGAPVDDKEFFVNLEMIIPEPYVILDDFSAFLPVNEDLEYEFTDDLFINVGNLTEASLKFDCKSCDGGECMGQSGVLDFNALFNNSNKTISVPANTLAPDSCYEIEVAVIYKGMVGINYGFVGTAGLSEKSYALQLSVQDGEFRKASQNGRIECDFDFEEKISPENTTLVSFDLVDSSKESLVGDCATLVSEKRIIRYTKDCLKPNEIYYADCILEGKGPNGVGKGRRVVQFNTKSSLEATATIIPSTGNEFTEFTLDIQVTHDYGAECRLGYIDPETYETVPFGKKISVGSNGSIQVKKQKLLTLTYADGESLLYTVWCTSKVTEDEDEPILDVVFTPYEGDDLATLQGAQVDDFTNTIGSINFTEAGQAASAQAADAIGDLITASAGFASATEAASEQIIDFIGEALDNLDFDTDENLAELVVESIIAVGELLDENINPDSAMKMMDTFETIFVGKQPGRNLAAEPTFDEVRGIKTVSEENVKQKSKKTCKTMLYALSELAGAADQAKKGGRIKKEQMFRKLMKNIERISKCCLNNYEEGTEEQEPGENIFILMKKVPKDQTSLNTETKYEFDCPCSTNYGFEAPASSYKSKSGKAASTGARAGSTSDSTTNNADKCYVNIPAFNDIDTDLSACSNLGFTIIATKNMCPGQANNESDTSGVDFTEVNNALLESSEYKASDYEGSDFLDSSSYEKIQCTGPSLDVSFYCIKGKRKDKDGKLIVQKIDIPKFKNSKTVSFKIGCSANQGTNSSDLVPSFLDESTGLNSVAGCKTDATTGNKECAHCTTFGYASTVSSTVSTGGGSGTTNGKRDFGARIFENYIFYLMLLIDIYFIVTLVYFFIAKKTNKNEIAVVDESKAMDEYNMKHPNKVEVASSMNAGEMRANNLGDNSSEHKSGEGNDSELHQASFCKKFKVGFMLKYRLLTPFTTSHPNLSRLSRGIINCLVLYFIWVVSGILLLLIEKAGASYGAAIPICFIISRLSTFALEILHRSSNGKTIEILSYFTAVTMAVVLHASIFLITEDMGKEFDYWGILLLTVFLIDLIVWEMLSLILQIYIGTKLASSPDNFSGKRKSLEKMVTPPLLKKFIDP